MRVYYGPVHDIWLSRGDGSLRFYAATPALLIPCPGSLQRCPLLVVHCCEAACALGVDSALAVRAFCDPGSCAQGFTHYTALTVGLPTESCVGGAGDADRCTADRSVRALGQRARWWGLLCWEVFWRDPCVATGGVVYGVRTHHCALWTWHER